MVPDQRYFAEATGLASAVENAERRQRNVVHMRQRDQRSDDGGGGCHGCALFAGERDRFCRRPRAGNRRGADRRRRSCQQIYGLARGNCVGRRLQPAIGIAGVPGPLSLHDDAFRTYNVSGRRVDIHSPCCDDSGRESGTEQLLPTTRSPHCDCRPTVHR